MDTQNQTPDQDKLKALKEEISPKIRNEAIKNSRRGRTNRRSHKNSGRSGSPNLTRTIDVR